MNKSPIPVSKTLDELIDEAFDAGFYGITIFGSRSGIDGARANLLTSISSALCDQITDPEVPASVRLRIMLETHRKPIARAPAPKIEVIEPMQVALFDDLLG